MLERLQASLRLPTEKATGLKTMRERYKILEQRHIPKTITSSKESFLAPRNHKTLSKTIEEPKSYRSMKYDKDQLKTERKISYSKESVRCKEHPDNFVNYFCEECSSGPHCPECILCGLHKGHNVLPLKNAFELIKSKISTKLVNCGRSISMIEESLQQREFESTHLLADGEKMKGQIENAMIEFERTIAQRREILIQSMERLIQTHLHEIENEKEQLTHEKVLLSQYRNRLQDSLKYSNSNDLISFYRREFNSRKDMSSKIETRRERKSLAEVFEPDIEHYIGWLKKIANEISVKLDFELPRTEAEIKSYKPRTLESAFKLFSELSAHKKTKNSFTIRKNINLLEPLELVRRQKISASPSYRKYLEQQNKLK